jgi:valyl-tRNA synthetase
MDLRYDEEKVKSTWNFINKLWNASRYVLMNIEDIKELNFDNLNTSDKWILNKLNIVIEKIRKHMDKYEFNVVGTELYNFIWNDFCDWYIELSKFNMNDTTKSVLLKVLTDILKLMHPFMPYVTEEIYQMLPIKDAESIMISAYPKVNDDYYFDTNLDDTIELIKNIRKIKLENNIGKEYSLKFDNVDNTDIITNVLKPVDLDITNLKEIIVNKNVSIFYDGSLNEAKELEELTKEKERLEKSVQRREKLLANQNYVSKAPSNIVDNERKQLEKEKEELNIIISKIK